MVLPVVLFSALRCMAWDFCMHFGDLLEIIFWRIDKSNTESDVALACFMLSPFTVLLFFLNLTAKVQQDRSHS